MLKDRALVMGAAGYIGSHLCRSLERDGISVSRGVRDNTVASAKAFDVMYYCAGVTGDFHRRPADTMQAHVASLLEAIRTIEFGSLVYLSSTRVYRTENTTEDAVLPCRPSDLDDLYNISKIAGESVALHCTAGRGRVARLSNVVGGSMSADSYIGQIAAAVQRREPITITSGSQYGKDYIGIDDAVTLIRRIGFDCNERTYNVASGQNVSNAEIASVLREIGVDVVMSDSGIGPNNPIDVSRIAGEFGFRARDPRAVIREVMEKAVL